MRVLHIIDYYGPQGGLHFYLNMLEQHLRKYGVQNYIVAREVTPYKLEDHLKDDRVVHLSGDELKRYAEKNGIDLVCFHDWLDNELMEYFASNYPVMRNVHDHHLFCPRLFFRDQNICPLSLSEECVTMNCIDRDTLSVCGERLAITKRFDRIAYFSDVIRDRLVAYGFCERKLCKFPTFISDNSHRYQENHGRENVILFSGRIVDYKGVEYLLASVAKLKKKNWKLVLAGTGDVAYVRKLVRRCMGYGIMDNVQFTGHLTRKELENYLSISKVFVFPSICHEGYGYSGADAFSFGVPIVAFDVGGVREWLKDSVNGYIVPIKDTDAMAQAIERLIDDPETWKAMRENAKAMSGQIPSLETQASAVYRTFKEIVQTKRE